MRLVGDGALGAAGTIVGSSSLGDVDTVREHVHLGWTMYRLPVVGHPRSTRSPSCCCSGTPSTRVGFGRVKIQTDVINARSRAAILRLGAVLEGITRRDVRRPDGTWRDSAVHSILVDEWPTVRAGLLARLASP